MWRKRIIDKEEYCMPFKKKKKNDLLPDSVSVIQEEIVIGDGITGNGDLFVRGTVNSSINIDASITIDSGGKVTKDIKCTNCTVIGSVEGNIHAYGHLCITEKGKVIGNVTCATLEVLTGGTFRGLCNQNETVNLPLPENKPEDIEEA
jgi:cytoskeletal protein CcmA (bactofilin family)